MRTLNPGALEEHVGATPRLRGRKYGEAEASYTGLSPCSADSDGKFSAPSTRSVLSETEGGRRRLRDGAQPALGKKSLLHMEERMPVHDIAAMRTVFQLLACFAGLQVCYLTWGYFQERLMTQTYGGDVFPSSVFLVFGNRVLALFTALAVVYVRRPNGKDPLSKRKMPHVLNFAPCSLSNVLGSWAQYECLKYISFPMQVCTIVIIIL